MRLIDADELIKQIEADASYIEHPYANISDIKKRADHRTGRSDSLPGLQISRNDRRISARRRAL